MSARFPQMLSVVVCTYNRAQYLSLCLKALLAQDYEGAWEIIVADDGSTDHTPAVIERARTRSGRVPLTHCWHEHECYRRAYTLNEGVRHSRGELLVFLDSDCIPAQGLLAAYALRASTTTFCLGGVLRLRKKFTQEILRTCDHLDPADFWDQAKQARHSEPRARRRFWKRHIQTVAYCALGVGRPRIWGGNWACGRAAFERVNGFDESFVGYGQEDSDIRDRLVLAGCRAVAAHRAARAFHLWHPVDFRARREARGVNGNRDYYHTRTLTPRCADGLRKEGNPPRARQADVR